MGSVKDPIIEPRKFEEALGSELATKAASYHKAADPNKFGQDVWFVSGGFSVRDLKQLIPPFTIKFKPEELAMTTSYFFEKFFDRFPGINNCYLGMLDKDGNAVDVQTLLDRGETSNLVLMRTAHVPETFCGGDLNRYRRALVSGELQCGVADVESIFRHGFPLGSSTFEKIFKAVRMGKENETLVTFDETVNALDHIRSLVTENGLSNFPDLERRLAEAQLGARIPNPGFVLNDIAYNTTSKFEMSGDRDLTQEEGRRFSGLDDEGYNRWTTEIFPAYSQAQIDFCRERNILNIDGKGECVAYQRKPVITDFGCTIDENRLDRKSVV